LPSSSPFVVPVTGVSMITVAAQAQLISVTAGKKTLEKISVPRLSVAYPFIPRTSP
jgi:predicted acyltransferase